MVVRKLNFIQTLRGISALIVCIHHSRYLVEIENENTILDSIRGSIGVSLFFIISGFIMVFATQNLSDNIIVNVKDFLIKRIIRIVPLFYFVIILYLIICHSNYLFYFTTYLNNFLKTILFIPLFTESIGPAYGFSFMYVSWSLNYEMLFYIIFALSLFFRKGRYVFIYLFITTSVFIMPLLFKGSFSFSYETTNNFSCNYLNFISNPILLLFLVGVTMGLVLPKIKIKPNLALYSLLGSIVIFSGYFFKLIPEFIGDELIICSLLVFTVLLMDYNAPGYKIPNFMVYLGNISYSLYLLHPIVYLYLFGLVKKVGYHWESSWYFVCIGILFVFISSCITYELIEKRFTAFLRKKLLSH